jgi:hypothetical protein
MKGIVAAPREAGRVGVAAATLRARAIFPARMRFHHNRWRSRAHRLLARRRIDREIGKLAAVALKRR